MPIRLTNENHPLAPQFLLEAVCDECGHRDLSCGGVRSALQRKGWRIPWHDGKLLCPQCKRKLKEQRR